MMNASFRIVLVYAAVASAWIILSDMIVSLLFTDVKYVTIFAMGKGLFYVGITSLLLFMMIKRALSEKNKNIEKLKLSVDEKNRLISELHHRIKNNLQMIASIIKIELSSNKSCVEEKDSVLAKILSMSTVHEIVYGSSDFISISLKDTMCRYASMFNALERGVSVRCEILENLSYNVETLNSLMLVVNEIVYCQPSGEILIESGRLGEVRISARPPLLYDGISAGKIASGIIQEISGSVSEESGVIVIKFVSRQD